MSILSHRRPMVPVLLLSSVLGLMADHPGALAVSSEAPAALVTTLEKVEAAANARDIDQIDDLYSATFQGPDGFTRAQYLETLQQFWAQYATLTYDVELLDWKMDGSALVVETLTLVQGTKTQAGRNFVMTAEVSSRQRYEGGLIVSQEILSEESHLESGTRPPTVTIRLPEAVSPGERFTFDAIVKEPLGNRLLLGWALDEGVTPEDFLVPRPPVFEELAAGGLFKVGKGTPTPDQRWISSVLVHQEGIVIDTQRLQVTAETTTTEME